MINLLPSENQREITQEQSWKTIMIIGTLLLAFFVSFSLILFLIDIFISGKVEAQKTMFQERENELKTSEMKSLEEELSGFSEKISRLDSFRKRQFQITDYLVRISSVFPVGTYLNSINIQPDKSDATKIGCNISGFSSTRENLFKLKENMEKEGSFEDVYFPPADWMEATSVNFTASFKLK